jgi:hypothetical protein
MYSNEQLNAIHFSQIGFSFNFFTKDNIKIVKKSISSVLNKKIQIGKNEKNNISTQIEMFTLDHDISGETGMIDFVTYNMPFVEAKLILSKTLKWIKENASTNSRCSVGVNISFNDKKIGPTANITKLDIGKFVLNFNEDLVYENFPNRKNSIYAKSIKFMLPLGGMTQSSPSKNSWQNYMFVNEDYYAINFNTISDNYLTFKYLGGANYENEYQKMLLMIEHFITSLYEILKNPTYSEEDLTKLDKVIADHKEVVQGYKTYKKFNEKYPKISLMIDLKTAPQIIEVYYPKIREKIFEFLTKANMKSGLINYDSDSSRIQIKDANLKQCFEISDVDIFQCTIKGNIKNCDIFDCEISDTRIIKSNLFGSTTCKKCKIEDSYISKNVEINNSFIFGKHSVFSGNMEGGVFKEGRATNFANISSSTKVIEIEKIKL